MPSASSGSTLNLIKAEILRKFPTPAGGDGFDQYLMHVTARQNPVTIRRDELIWVEHYPADGPALFKSYSTQYVPIELNRIAHRAITAALHEDGASAF